VVKRRLVGEFQNLDVTQECDQGGFVLLSSRRQFYAEQECRFRNNRDAHVADRHLPQPFQDRLARSLHLDRFMM
jgi:hypothetical protein